jgi:hypothetical protein
MLKQEAPTDTALMEQRLYRNGSNEAEAPAETSAIKQRLPL